MIPVNKCSVIPKAKQAKRGYPVETMRYKSAVMLCVFAGLFGAFAHADASNTYLLRQDVRPAINLQGGCIAPSAPSETIRLDVMRVTFRCKRDSYLVDARYHLFNADETVTVKVGVPKYGRPDRDEDWPEPVVCDFIRFDAWVNGRKAAFVETRDFFTDPVARPVGGYCNRGPAETRWMTKRVTFKGKATTVIRVRYEAHYHNRYNIGCSLEDTGYYHGSVGRYWKDKIKKAVFVIDVTDIKGNDWGVSSHGGRAAFTSFITVSEVRQWEPSSVFFQEIPGSSSGAKWRAFGPRYIPADPGGKLPAAPTPCAGKQ